MAAPIWHFVNGVPNLNGSLVMSGGLTASGTVSGNALVSLTNVQAGASSVIFWASRSRMESTADGVVALTNQAGTGFTSLNLNTTKIQIGTGSPENAVSANTGSVYLNLSGGSTTTLYVKASGTGSTGWLGK
jgi:hypothetical protein